MSIGYLKLISKHPRTWKLYDADGREIASGDCVHCTMRAMQRDMQIVTIQ